MDAVTINKGQGGLQRQPAGRDFISGLVLYGTISGWVSGTIKEMLSIADAVTNGITNTHVGETAAILETACATGSTGDSVNIYFQEPIKKVLLATYTQTSGDTTDTLLATHIAAAINANTVNTGYTAAGSTGNLLVTLRPGLGIWANVNFATLMTFTYSVGATLLLGAATNPTPGVFSEIDIMYYHINRFFTQAPNATLYTSVTTVPSWSAYAYGEVGTMQTANSGAIRQCGVYKQHAYATADITAIQAQINTLVTNKVPPMSCIYGADLSATTAAVLPNLATLNSEHVSFSAGQDGNAQGWWLSQVSGMSITQVGDIVGLIAAAQVSDDIGWPQNYNLAIDGVENVIPAFATGELLSALSNNTLNQVDAYRYIFGNIAVDNSPSGTFVNEDHCCTLTTSDYAYIHNNRTIDKAARSLYPAYFLQLKAPLVVQSNGNLTNPSAQFFNGVGEQALAPMAANNANTGRPELSNYSVNVNPVLGNVGGQTYMYITAKIQPIGVAQQIVINLAFAVTIQ
jgi:hypothetical protein